MTYLAELCALDGVSSFEDPVRDYIRERAAAAADDIAADTLGNLIVTRRGTRRAREKIMLSAHMDEVGFIVSEITDEGYLKFLPVGGIDRRVVAGKRVRVGADALPGVVGMAAVHLTTPEERKRVPKFESFAIDIGAKDRESAARAVELGDPVAFDTAPEILGDRLFKAKAIDDRVGCAVLLDILLSEPPVDCTYTFVVQEEVGLRGAGPAAHRVAPDVCIVVEGTTAADLPGVPEHKRACRVGAGAVLPFMDRSAYYSAELHAELCGIAERRGIPYQLKTYVAGGTDAGAIQRSRAGVRTAAVSAPVRYIHSPASVTGLSDIRAVRDLVRAYLETMGEK